MILTRTIALLALLPSGLHAQAPTFGLEGQVSALVATGTLNRMVKTGNLAGYHAGLALRTGTSPGLGFRLYANLLSLRGVDGSGLESGTPHHLHAGLDVLKVSGKVTFFGGMGILKWKQDDTSSPTFTDAGGRNNAGKGTKLSGRLGLEYEISPKVHGVVSFTQTEFNKLYQPSWFSLGVSYRFASF
ncbi:outer membrane beta-barrel protein [Mesoterricola silvestris]|uniref:Outer membrane protein beta-barrel domain-containing protein n=1 Tax=Mesoterricola silvestris TaxID=2927979 RepID=A0AA48GMF3_9BACT|nr:outer membrane beta-barrel protein [Mesoterricola silvestris]BDU72539.1 hypothetical protein METEAL_17130 [Mesoterricola silvestris]